MTARSFQEAANALQHAFPGTKLITEGDRKFLRIPELPMSGAWTPDRVRGLLVCDNWPAQRPQLLIGDELRRNGADPANFSRQVLNGEAWFGFSFSSPYSPDYPALVPVVRGWLGRFDGRAD